MNEIKLLEMLFGYNKKEEEIPQDLIDYRNEIFHEYKLEKVDELYNGLEGLGYIEKIEETEENQKYAEFITEFIKKMSIFDYESKVERTTLKSYLQSKGKAVLYYYRNILYHEITTIGDLAELAMVLDFTGILDLFDNEVSHETQNRLGSYYNQRYKDYYISKEYSIVEPNHGDEINYVTYSKPTPIEGITAHIFTHINAEFYSINVSNYNHTEHQYQNINYKGKNFDLNEKNIHFGIECADDYFSILLNYYQMECIAPISIKAYYNVQSKEMERESIFIPFSDEYNHLARNGDVMKDDSVEEYYTTLNNIKTIYGVCDYGTLWKNLKKITHEVLSDVNTMKKAQDS